MDNTEIPNPNYQKLIEIPFVYNLCKRKLRIDNKYMLFKMGNTMYLNTSSSGFPLEYIPSDILYNNINGSNSKFSGIEYILNAYHLYLHYYNDPYASYFSNILEKTRRLTFDFHDKCVFGYYFNKLGDVIGLWRMFIQQNAPVPDWIENNNPLSRAELENKSIKKEIQIVHNTITNLTKALTGIGDRLKSLE